MSNSRYENFVLEDKLNEALTTGLSISQFLTIDESLKEEAGMMKKINKYSSTGDVQDVAEGYGNTSAIEMGYTQETYTVGTTQGRFIYTDEDEMTDPFLVDAGITDLGKKLVNNMVDKAIDEYKKASKNIASASISFDDFVDAIALLNKENDEEAGLFALVNPDMKGKLRKAMGDDLKYVEAFVRSGYIGSVCGVPVYVSKAIPNDMVIIASKKAVTAFVKKSTEIEQDRDKNTRTNTIYGRFVNVVALTNDDEVAFIAKASTTPTITTYTKNAKTVAGTCGAGAEVKVYINGVFDGKATVSGTSFTYTAKANLAAADVVKVIAREDGKADATASQTVAA